MKLRLVSSKLVSKRRQGKNKFIYSIKMDLPFFVGGGFFDQLIPLCTARMAIDLLTEEVVFFFPPEDGK